MLASQHKHQPNSLSQIFCIVKVFWLDMNAQQVALETLARHLLCSMLHPKATCVFVDNVRHSHVRIDPLCVFFSEVISK